MALSAAQKKAYKAGKIKLVKGSYVKKGVTWSADGKANLTTKMIALKSKSTSIQTKVWINQCPACKKKKVLIGAGVRNLKIKKTKKNIKINTLKGCVVCSYCGVKFCGVTGKATKSTKKLKLNSTLMKAINEAKKEFKSNKPKWNYELTLPATIDLKLLRHQTYCELRNPLVKNDKQFWIDELVYSEDLREITLTDGVPEPEEKYTAEKKTKASSTSGKLSDSDIKKQVTAVAKSNSKYAHSYKGGKYDCISMSNKIYNQLKAKKIGCRVIKFPSSAARNGYHFVVNVKYSSGYKCFPYSYLKSGFGGCKTSGTKVKEYKP